MALDLDYHVGLGEWNHLPGDLLEHRHGLGGELCRTGNEKRPRGKLDIDAARRFGHGGELIEPTLPEREGDVLLHFFVGVFGRDRVVIEAFFAQRFGNRFHLLHVRR